VDHAQVGPAGPQGPGAWKAGPGTPSETVGSGHNDCWPLPLPQIGDRWLDGQAHLTDLIHPGEAVALEVANVLLNLVAQAGQA
jgi:hypothetical protein